MSIRCAAEAFLQQPSIVVYLELSSSAVKDIPRDPTGCVTWTGGSISSIRSITPCYGMQRGEKSTYGDGESLAAVAGEGLCAKGLRQPPPQRSALLLRHS